MLRSTGVALVAVAVACSGGDRRVDVAKTTAATAARPAARGLLDAVLDSLRARNHNLAHAAVLDVRPLRELGDPRFVVVATGTTEDPSFKGIWRDEMFGVFVVNDSLSRVVATLGDFPTLRWHDYRVWVDSVTPDSVIVRGRGDMYGDQPSRHAFALPRADESTPRR